MDITLSSAAVKAYRKRSGVCSFHLSTVLLVGIGWNFAISHIKRLSVTMLLPDGGEIPFELSMNVDSDYRFDGETNAITLNLNAVSDLTWVDWWIVTLIVEGTFDFGGTMPRFRHVQRGTLRPMF